MWMLLRAFSGLGRGNRRRAVTDAVLWIAFAMIAMTALTSLAARRMRGSANPYCWSWSVPRWGLRAAISGRQARSGNWSCCCCCRRSCIFSGVGHELGAGFRKYLRPIMLMARRLCAVHCIRRCGQRPTGCCICRGRVGFVLGCGGSLPPDAVAPDGPLRGALSVPKRILTVLEGEGPWSTMRRRLILFSFRSRRRRHGRPSRSSARPRPSPSSSSARSCGDWPSRGLCCIYARGRRIRKSR